jgi:hypothetical protein
MVCKQRDLSLGVLTLHLRPGAPRLYGCARTFPRPAGAACFLWRLRRTDPAILRRLDAVVRGGTEPRVGMATLSSPILFAPDLELRLLAPAWAWLRWAEVVIGLCPSAWRLRESLRRAFEYARLPFVFACLEWSRNACRLAQVGATARKWSCCRPALASRLRTPWAAIRHCRSADRVLRRDQIARSVTGFKPNHSVRQ